MIATKRADGSYVLGDVHGDLVDDEGTGWAAAEGRSDADFEREVMRRRKRRERARRRAERRTRWET